MEKQTMGNKSLTALLVTALLFLFAAGDLQAQKSRVVKPLLKKPASSSRVVKPAPVAKKIPSAGVVAAAPALPTVTPRANSGSAFKQDWNALRKRPVAPPKTKATPIASKVDGTQGKITPTAPSPAFNNATSESVQRAMSRVELKATKETGLVRGGRGGTHHVSDSVNENANRARQRLALPQTPEVKVEMRVPKGSFSEPKKIKEANGMPGGGMERTGTGPVPASVKKVKGLGKK